MPIFTNAEVINSHENNHGNNAVNHGTNAICVVLKVSCAEKEQSKVTVYCWLQDSVNGKSNCLIMQRPVCAGDKCIWDKGTARGQWQGWNISPLFTAHCHVLIKQLALFLRLINVYLNHVWGQRVTAAKTAFLSRRKELSSLFTCRQRITLIQ